MIILTGVTSLIPNFDKDSNKIGMLTTEIIIEELLEVYKIDDTVNRDIDYGRVIKLSNYIKQFDTDLGIYIPAIILVYEGKNPENENDLYMFEKAKSFIVIDGQHRIKALEHYLSNETDRVKKEKILQSKITLQIYFNLRNWQKRQLFIEINGKSKKVTKNLSVKYDDRNPVNSLVSDLLKNKRSNPLLRMGIEMEKARIVRPNNHNWISMIRLSRFTSFLLFGTGEVSTANKNVIKQHYEHFFSFLQQYFILLESSLPKEPGNVNKNILGHEAIQNTIALVCHEKIVIKKDDSVFFHENWKYIVEMLEYIDWSVSSSIFKKHLVTSGGSSKYFGFSDSKHYDLVPLLSKELDHILG